MGKLKFLIVFFLCINILFAKVGSVNLNFLIKFHPYSIFFYNGYKKKFLSMKNLKVKKYDLEILYLLQVRLSQKIKNENKKLSNELLKIYQEESILLSKKSMLLTEYEDLLKKNRANDREYFKKKQEIEDKLLKLGAKKKKIKTLLDSKYFADFKEIVNIKNKIYKDIILTLKNIKRKYGLKNILFYPGYEKKEKEWFPKKENVLKFCAYDKNTYTDHERKQFKRFLDNSKLYYPDFLLSHKDFILYGGRDYTIEVLEDIFSKYKVDNKILDIIKKGDIL